MKYLLILFLSGCSVISAFSGSKEPDMSNVVKGNSKEIVDVELGEPVQELDKNSFLYTYKKGDEPAPGRAVMHALLDICTLFLWEYIAFPMEISNSGNAYNLQVYYDENNKVINTKELK